MLTYASLTQTASLAWAAYHAPMLAGAVALLLVLLARASGRLTLAAAAGPLAVAVGWAAVLLPAGWRAVLQPRTAAEHLALPALAAVTAAMLLPYMRGRWGAVLPVLLAVVTGWWLAGSPAVRPEFWRVWAVAAVLAWGLARLVGADAARIAAAALALWGALLAVGAPPAWQAISSVVAAVGLAVLAGRPPPPVAPFAVLVAAAAVAASLGAGRLVRGQVGAVDAACAAALAAPLLSPVLARRMGRAGWLAPVLSAAVAAVAAWVFASAGSRIVPLR